GSSVGSLPVVLGSPSGHMTKEMEQYMRSDPESAASIACFLCRQLMAASGQRVGLSQNQLQIALENKCRALPAELMEHCTSFVNTFLQEIYFSLNYDFSAKNVCVALNICDKDLEITFENKSEREVKEKEARIKEEKKMKEKEEIEEKEKKEKERKEREEKKRQEEKEKEEKMKKRRKGIIDDVEEMNRDEKRLNCMFCERMLDNAKRYAETAKADIESFASTACSKWPRVRFAESCHRMAEEKITKLNKFVDEQVVEALWCGELYNCD
ncbi:hypothetical protein PFISCL1PPCAC_15741, partial [Pristionchus fissidentatus]